MPTKPLILKRRQLAKTRLFQIEEQDLQFANGARRVYERLLRFGEGAVLIVPMLDDETVLLVREYGAGIGDYQIALPKGAIDPGEDALQAANRELMEEVGRVRLLLVHLVLMELLHFTEELVAHLLVLIATKQN